jgi:hypothetical protein
LFQSLTQLASRAGNKPGLFFLSRRVALWQRKLFQCSGALFISDGNLYNFYNHFMALFIVKRQKTCANLILQLILIHDSGGNYFATCDGVGQERKKAGRSHTAFIKNDRCVDESGDLAK